MQNEKMGTFQVYYNNCSYILDTLPALIKIILKLKDILFRNNKNEWEIFIKSTNEDM